MKIKLPCGNICEIDSQDKFLRKIFPHWRFSGSEGSKRVLISRYIKTEWGKVRQDVHLSRAILKPRSCLLIDHKDRNPLNNKRSNLRYATYSQNAKNRKKETGKTSIYYGVSFCKKVKTNPWRVFVRTPDGKRLHGCFSSEIDAAKKADEVSYGVWGDFAPLNFARG